MNTTLSDLDFSRWDLLFFPLATAIINLAIVVYVLLYLQQNVTNLLFSIFVFLAACCVFADGFAGMSQSLESEHQWCRITNSFILFVVPVGILFTLHISKILKVLSNGIIFITFFLPIAVSLVVINTGLDKYGIIKTNGYYHIKDTFTTSGIPLIYLWASAGAILMFGLLWFSYYNTKEQDKTRPQLLLMATGFTLSLALALTTNILFPFLTEINISLTPICLSVFSITSLIAIKKFGPLKFSPKHKWEQIVENMNEGILIVDNDDRIMYVNKMFCESLNYTRDEVKGKIAHELFLDAPDKKHIEKVLRERKEKKSEQYEIQLKAKSGEKIWMKMSGSPYTDNSGNVIGSIGIQTNINNEKKVEALFRALVENVGDIISLIDKEGNLIYVSPMLEKVTGFTLAEVEGKPATSLMHPDFSKEAVLLFKDLLNNPGISIPVINRFLHKNGHYVWVEGTITNLLNDTNIQAVVSSHRDITVRKEAEEKIKQSEENLHAIFENTSEGFILADVNGFIKYLNNTAKETIFNNVDKEVTLGNSIYDFIDPERRGFFDDIIKRVLKGETIQYDKFYDRKDGSRKWLDFTLNPVHDDESLNGFCITGRDITERKSAEQLRAMIMNSALDAIVCMDKEGLITLWNPSAEKIFGWKEKEVIGRKMSETIIPHQYRLDHERGFKEYLETRKNNILNKVLEITALNKHQKEFPVELSIIPLKQQDSEFFCAFIKDISKRKEAEENLRSNEERLRMIIDNEPECVKIVDVGGTLLEMNPAGLEILGVKEMKNVVGKNIINFVYEDDKQVYENLHTKVCNGEKGTADFRMMNMQNALKWMESNSVPLKNANGEVYAVLSVARDITEIKISQEKLISNEKRYHALVENGADAVFILSAESKPLYVSSSISQVTGYTEEEAMEYDLFSLTCPDDIAEFKKVIQEALLNPGKSIRGYTGRLKHKDGTWHWYESTITNMLHDPSINGIIDNFRDITERKFTEDRIKESETNLKAIFENTLEGFFLIDNNNILKAFNNKAKEIIERNHKVKNQLLAGENFFNFIEDSRKQFFENSVEQIKKGITVVYNRSYVQRNGNIVWLNYSIIPVIDDSGINGYCITAHDITNLKEAELQKEFDTNNLNALINNTNNLMWSVDKNLCLITSNSAFEHQYKLFSGKAVTKGQSVMIEQSDSDTLHRWKNYYKRAIDGEMFTVVEYIKMPVEGWSEISFYPVKKGIEVIGTACYAHNITERKKFERELHKNNDELIALKNDLEHSALRLKQAQAIAHVGNWEVNFETGKVIWSDEACKIYGLTPGKDILNTDTLLSFVHHEDIQFVNKEIMKSQESYADSSFYHRIVRKDGEIRNVLTESRFEFNNDNKPTGIYGVIHDVTNEKIAEERLVELNAKLGKRANELAISNEELEQFAYIASHDLQEPLRMVTGFLTQLGNKYSGQLDDRAREYIYYATDGAVRMRQIILDLLEYSRVGRKELEFQTIDMNILVAQTVQLNRVSIQEKGAVVHWKDLPVICGGDTLQQVLQNLLVNSLKYQKDNVTPIITITALESPQYWQFDFKDNGIGIEERFFDKIFVVFQRLHNREKYSGTGIGLAICKKIIENHNGKIWIESVPGEGSTFHFTISKTLVKK